jgi:integrase
MASLHLVDGHFRITWPLPNEKKGCVRTGLPKSQERAARTAFHHVEAILNARSVGANPGADTVAWVNSLDDKGHARLARAGLVVGREPVAQVTLGQLWERFLAAKSVKPGTRLIYDRVWVTLEAHFGKDRPIASIGIEQAEGWCKTLADVGFAVATRSKHTHVAKGLFRRAVLWGLLSRSPFESIRPGPQTNTKRQAYIPLDDLEKIIAAAPSHDWKCIFALARLAALRTPSEIVGLTWGHIDFDARTMIVHSPKTEHHADGATRIVPIGPRLHDILMAAFTAAEPGTVYVVPRLRQADTNLRTHAHRILARAGVQPPPKVFVNCRASCATDWARDECHSVSRHHRRVRRMCGANR